MGTRIHTRNYEYNHKLFTYNVNNIRRTIFIRTNLLNKSGCLQTHLHTHSRVIIVICELLRLIGGYMLV